MRQVIVLAFITAAGLFAQAEADGTVVGVNSYERVNAILGPEFVAPAAFGCRAAQTCAADFADFHGLET